MANEFLSPKEIANAIIEGNVTRSKLKTVPCILLGIMAGLFIAFGGLANIVVSQTLGVIDIGMAKFMGAAVFPVGLMLVVMCGAELFTGNNLMALAVIDKRIHINKMFRNWSLVYIANFIGSLLLVLAVFYGGVLTGDAATKTIAIAESKVVIPVVQSVIRGILCNIIVVLAVWMATGAKDIISKIFACWFPIMLFVVCGFEHSVANMFFIPMGMILGADITVGQLFFNLIPVTIGNLIGGAVFVPFMYHRIYVKKENDIKKHAK